MYNVIWYGKMYHLLKHISTINNHHIINLRCVFIFVFHYYSWKMSLKSINKMLFIFFCYVKMFLPFQCIQCIEYKLFKIGKFLLTCLNLNVRHLTSPVLNCLCFVLSIPTWLVFISLSQTLSLCDSTHPIVVAVLYWAIDSFIT